jgi:monoamine oxidase
VKTKAIDRVKVSNSVKVFLAFDAPFWPEGLFDVVCAGCFLPEMWILKYPTTENVGRNSGARMASDQGVDPSVPARTKEVVTFFAAGNLADELSRMERKTVVERALDQMDEMFGTETDPKPSRSRLTGSYVADWRREELVGGAYTYPTLHAFGSREVVAAPDGESVFFAGEATHPGVNPCMQGAMETGLRAAAQVLSAVRPPKSGL